MDLVETLGVVTTLFERWGYIIVFFGSLIEITPIGWLVPGGAILAVAGYLSNGNPQISLIGIIISGTLGGWIAFILAYAVGRKTGMWLVNKLNQQKNAEFAKKLLKSHGGKILTTSMMANLTRFWVSYIAGVDGYSFLKFNKYAAVASLSWVSILVIIGDIAGYEKENIKSITKGLGVLAWVFLAVAVYVIFRTIRHEYKHFIKDSIHNENS